MKHTTPIITLTVESARKLRMTRKLIPAILLILGFATKSYAIDNDESIPFYLTTNSRGSTNYSPASVTMPAGEPDDAERIEKIKLHAIDTSRLMMNGSARTLRNIDCLMNRKLSYTSKNNSSMPSKVDSDKTDSEKLSWPYRKDVY